jgi:uncharacterized protein (DUF58 family)
VKATLDAALVERAVTGLRLRVPRGPHRGRSGDARAASVGSSIELHDFRGYQPGDDLRQIDWNAVARTGEMVLRIRQEEVSPRCEVVLDGSASMGTYAQKALRAREVAAACCALARHAGLDLSLGCTGHDPRRFGSVEAVPALERVGFDHRVSFEVALGHLPPARPCGLRIVISDFLLEAAPNALVERLARSASHAVLLQVLAAEDLEPAFVGGARLTDAESGEALDRTLRSVDLERYHHRLQAHVALWHNAAARVHASFIQLSAAKPLSELLRGPMSALVEAT